MTTFFSAQGQEPNWQNSDLKADNVFGMSVEKAYKELLKNRKSIPVIVAVIDGGIDTTHEDLRSVLWNNEKEIAGNQKDDDKNGYVDDTHGWNFIGGTNGSVSFDNLEITRLIRGQKEFYDSLSFSIVPTEYRSGYQLYRKIKKEYDSQIDEAQSVIRIVERLKRGLHSLVKKMGKENPVLQDFQNYSTDDEDERKYKQAVISQLQTGITYTEYLTRVDSLYIQYKQKAEYQLNVDYDPRNIVGDDPLNLKERYYGNNDVYGPCAQHGTHVAGIIAAVRSNKLGVQGIADLVQLMAVRVVPNGDERDKDVANGIKYAVDNGAKVINLSFGKPYSPNRIIVDEAIKYALSKDVLLIHAAGNDGKNLDQQGNTFFPERDSLDKEGRSAAWIEVGASGMKDDSTLVPSFSNYGKTAVDVFAPGVQIYSTVPDNHYEYLSGTSMAAPAVSGVAALIRSYYPKLNALQVKEIILKSVVKVDHNVIIKVNGSNRAIPFSEICVTGGVVNAYNALKLAENYK